MAYTKINWEDLPNTTTPINATNLGHMDDGIANALTSDNIKNAFNNSTTDTYSCDYVNQLVQDVYSTEEIKTNEIEIVNGVEYPRYRKVLRFTTDAQANSWKNIPSGITNLREMIEVKAKIERSNYVNAVPFRENDTTFIDLSYVKGSTNLTYRAGSAMTELPVRVELIYTKTTD